MKRREEREVAARLSSVTDTLQLVRRRYGLMCEVTRCAAGVVRTADPQRVKDAVVAEWWKALERALDAAGADGEATAGGTAMTREGLAHLLPKAHLELVDGELVVWTGWAVDPKNASGPLVDWDPDVHGDRARGER